MDKTDKLCPFKKGVVRQWVDRLSENEQPNMKDVFMPCDGEHCMAYDGGNCRKLPTQDPYPLQKEARQ